MNHPPTAAAYPSTVPERTDLTGHTVTVELLDKRAGRAHRMPAFIGQLVIAERTDGCLTRLFPAPAPDPDTAERDARTVACAYGAVYTPMIPAYARIPTAPTARAARGGAR